MTLLRKFSSTKAKSFNVADIRMLMLADYDHPMAGHVVLLRSTNKLNHTMQHWLLYINIPQIRVHLGILWGYTIVTSHLDV